MLPPHRRAKLFVALVIGGSMVAPSIKNVAGYNELIAYIDDGITGTRTLSVLNSTGSTITKGSVVYLSGSNGTDVQISNARANAVTTMPAIGVLGESIATGRTGTCTFSGLLTGLDTSAYVAGNFLYVSGATPGALTAVEPVHPNLSQLVAIVITVSATAGLIFIYPCFDTHGKELGSLSNTFKVGDGAAGAKVVQFVNAFVGQLSWTPTAARTLTLPDATDTLIGKATTDTLTNKTYDTAGTGNVFRINGTGVTAVTGTGAVVLANTPSLTTPDIGAATGTSLALSGGFGCNTKSPQTAYAMGAALTAYAPGVNGLAVAADMAALVAKVNSIAAALIANGIGS